MKIDNVYIIPKDEKIGGEFSRIVVNANAGSSQRILIFAYKWQN